jgi:hypothetical protein
MFHFGALGVLWFSESPFQNEYNSIYHNPVLIDGIGSSDTPPAKGDYSGANMMNNGAFASADLTYNYTWKWCTQVSEWGTGFSSLGQDRAYRDGIWEIETRPEIIDIFRGTQNYKMRYWWATSNQGNFIPTLRAPWNPVEYVYRTVGLIRGAHSYGIIADDLKKDEQEHTYQWTGIFGMGVWKSTQKTPYKQALLLAYDANLKGNSTEEPVQGNLSEITPDRSTPQLLVYLAGASGSEILKTEKADGAVDRQGVQRQFCRLSIEKKARETHYKILLIPIPPGTKIPDIKENGNVVEVKWDYQADTIHFMPSDDNQTRIVVERNDQVMAMSK